MISRDAPCGAQAWDKLAFVGDVPSQQVPTMPPAADYRLRAVGMAQCRG